MGKVQSVSDVDAIPVASLTSKNRCTEKSVEIFDVHGVSPHSGMMYFDRAAAHFGSKTNPQFLFSSDFHSTECHCSAQNDFTIIQISIINGHIVSLGFFWIFEKPTQLPINDSNTHLLNYYK